MALHSEKHDSLNAIALCAGVGGLEIGLHIAEPNFRTVCFVEWEAFAAATIVARMEDEALDNAPVWDDVTTFDGKPWRGKVHIITGGYPCQPFSFAGLRKGEKDPRHLWPDIKRIINEVEPVWCFFENVEGHLSLGADAVINDLQAMGFTVKAGLFSALETGASQIRRRLFILAHSNKVPLLQPAGAGTEQSGLEIQGRSDTARITDIVGQSGTAVVTADSADQSMRCETGIGFQLPIYPPAPYQFGDWSQILDRHPELQPELFGLADGMANRMDRSNAAGNGVVSLAAAYAWRTLKAAHYSISKIE